jgi:hypothetical protein
MSALVHQRCFHHSLREAVARCPECRQFYCRECITEHEDRVICATCLKKITATPKTKRAVFAWVLPLVQFSVGVSIIWFLFYLCGATLLSIPSSFHEGSVWIDRWWKTE